MCALSLGATGVTSSTGNCFGWLMSWYFVSTVQCKTKCLQRDSSECIIWIAFCPDYVHFYCFLLCCVVSLTKFQTSAFGVIWCIPPPPPPPWNRNSDLFIKWFMYHHQAPVYLLFTRWYVNFHCPLTCWKLFGFPQLIQFKKAWNCDVIEGITRFSFGLYYSALTSHKTIELLFNNHSEYTVLGLSDHEIGQQKSCTFLPVDSLTSVCNTLPLLSTHITDYSI